MEYDYYPEEEEHKKSLIGTIFKYAVLALVIFTYVLIMFRIFIKEDPKAVKEFVWTEQSLSAYNENSSTFKVQNQQIRSFTYEDEASGETVKVIYNTITEDGYFQVSNFMYVEATKELIVTFRYNNASLKWLENKYSLPGELQTEPYLLSLSVKDEMYTDYSYLEYDRFTYDYRQLVFKNIQLPESGTVNLNVYYMGEFDLNTPIASLTVYDSRIPVEYYSIKKALPAELTKGFKNSPYISDTEE